MIVTSEGRGLGWLRDYPDHRDYSFKKPNTPPEGERENVQTLLRRARVAEPAPKLPGSVDLRQLFSPIEDQGNLGSCTANAGGGLLEYFELNAHGKYIDASRLFLYKATRNLMGQKGDTGAYLRTTMQAMVNFGVCPEQYWPYTDSATAFDREPSAFCYSFGQDYRTIQYYKLAPAGTPPEELLQRIKTNLAANLPSMFGFTVFSSYRQAETTGEFPYPTTTDTVEGGHAVVAAGFDDDRQIKNAPNRGAILIRNSWGTSWGEEGYGWLPYDYVLDRLATDWWSLIRARWIDQDFFGLSS